MVVALMGKSYFSLRTVVSMISLFYGCSHFFLCLSGVEESVYGLNDFICFSALYVFKFLFRSRFSVSVGVFVVVDYFQ